ncbi:hypothetical protein MAP00_007108 [Monascus purpureus]|nr:hypothetical protein MAP00_007108 [Monascus purpureus]
MCHATHYSKPSEQRYIIRILWMIPIYSVVAWLSIYFYRKSVYFGVLGNCYEAFTIAAFFSLLCYYLAPDLHMQKDYFRAIKPKTWVWPLTWLARCCGGERGCWRTPRSGLTWFNIIWVGVFQYCLARVSMTIVSVITEANGRYCEESLNPAFSHVWVMCIEAACVTIAMYCLIQFYIQIKDDISQYSPFMKILSIKLVIFLSFWQTTLISFLVSSGAIKATKTVGTTDLKVGIPNLLITIEMALFSFLHLFAFAWKPYTISDSMDPYVGREVTYYGGPFGIKAIIDSFNPWDLVKATARSIRWLFVGRKKRMLDPSYQRPDDSISLRNGQGMPSTSIPGTNVTAYGGAGAVMSGGRYGGEEEQVLLAHAQAEPTSYAMHSTGDLGMASYDSDRPLYHDSPPDSRPFNTAPVHSGQQSSSYYPPAPLESNAGYGHDYPSYPYPSPYRPPPHEDR